MDVDDLLAKSDASFAHVAEASLELGDLPGAEDPVIPIRITAHRISKLEAAPSILDAISHRRNWEKRDPGRLYEPLGPLVQGPICNCMSSARSSLGGMNPALDLETHSVRCRTCGKEIGSDCQRKAVRHLRKLLKMHREQPHLIDLDDCRAAGFLF